MSTLEYAVNFVKRGDRVEEGGDDEVVVGDILFRDQRLVRGVVPLWP